MSNAAVHARGLGKMYRIGAKAESYRTLRDALVNTLTAPISRLRNPGHASRRLDSIWALRDVSLEVKPGETVGIIGRNGAGKSTLLKILSRITQPTEGRVELRGRVGSLLEVGTGFHPELTGRENVYLNGAILGMRRTEIDRKFDEIVSFAEIDRFLDTPVKRYSSGMYVRLAFAVAAHLETDILLVDEVLAVGDYEFQKKCLGQMRSVSQGGRTVVFVSHNMASISNLCKKTVWLDAGAVALEGDTSDVVASYVSSVTDSSLSVVGWQDPRVAPGNTRVRLKSIRVLSEGAPAASVRIDRDVGIEITYWNLKDGAILDAVVHLRDRLDSFVLASASRASANLIEDPWFGKRRPRGVYRSTCVIPANFLNDDPYSVDVGLVNQRNEWEVRLENAVSFAVHETGEMRKEYSGPWVGAVRPKLAWKTDRLCEG